MANSTETRFINSLLRWTLFIYHATYDMNHDLPVYMFCLFVLLFYVINASATLCDTQTCNICRFHPGSGSDWMCCDVSNININRWWNNVHNKSVNVCCMLAFINWGSMRLILMLNTNHFSFPVIFWSGVRFTGHGCLLCPATHTHTDGVFLLPFDLDSENLPPVPVLRHANTHFCSQK